jgi:hypothetical protein
LRSVRGGTRIWEKPMPGIVLCCAGASGRIIVAPPANITNSRHLMTVPGEIGRSRRSHCGLVGFGRWRIGTGPGPKLGRIGGDATTGLLGCCPRVRGVSVRGPVGFGAGCAIFCGRARLGSVFGARVVIPVGPLRDTWFGSMLSRRHSLMVSPSARVSGLPPGTAKIARRRSGSMTIPVSRTFGNPGSEPRPAVGWSGGRRVALNKG